MNYEDRVTKEYVEGLLSGGAKIATGSYVGTGQYGSGHPNELTFDFTPKLVLLFCGVGASIWHTGDMNHTILLWGVTTTLRYSGSYNNTVSYSGNTISWYTTANFTDAQLNANNYEYHYVAIG